MSEPRLLYRLRERKLVQWALAYLAGAFVVFQLLDALAEPLGLSTTVQQAILVVVGIGFFIALVLAWYHGEKGRQRVSGPELLMVAALLVVAGVALSMVRESGEPGSDPTRRGDDSRPTIAVLPLENLSPNPEHSFFAAGVQEDLTAKLQGIPTLAVISRSSVERYRDPVSRPPLGQIASELGADYLLEGSARVRTDSVRITVQLIEGETDTHLWADDYDSPYSVEDYVRLQAEIVQRIAADLRASVSPEDVEWLNAIPTGSLEAMEAYMRGNEVFVDGRVRGNTTLVSNSVGLFESALEADPDFLLARARLALAITYTSPNPERIERAGAHAKAVLALLPDHSDARLALGRVSWGSEDVAEAERQFQRVVAEDPNSVDGLIELGQLKWGRGETEAAIAYLREAEALDPQNPVISRALMQVFMLAHRYDEALQANAKTAALFGGGYPIYYRIWIHLLRGAPEEARAAISELIAEDPDRFVVFAPVRAHDVIFRFMTSDERHAVLSGYEARSNRSCTYSNYCFRKAVHLHMSAGPDRAKALWDSLAANPGLTTAIVANVGLGENAGALSAARQWAAAEDSAGYRAGHARVILATVLAQFGEADLAVDLLEELVEPPSLLSIHILEIDPAFDPIRDHPRFQALLEEHLGDVEH
jgi:serine/threonine-protein kinase